MDPILNEQKGKIIHQGWKLPKAKTDKVADTITQIAQDENLTIDEVRDKICNIDEKIQMNASAQYG